MSDSISINPPVFDPTAAYGIGGIAVVTAALCVALYAGGNRRRAGVMAAGFAVLMAGSALAATSGLLSRFDVVPPPMVVMIAGVLVVSVAIGLSPFGRTVAHHTPLAALVGLQGFRLPLELVMHHAADRAIMPVQLSFSGYNFDILTGIGALVLLLLLKRKAKVPRKEVWAWNLWGMLCLVAIVIIAVATSPMVRAFGDDPADLNTWVLYFPYVWLPVVLVTIALSGHIIITRKLLHERGTRRGRPL